MIDHIQVIDAVNQPSVRKLVEQRLKSFGFSVCCVETYDQERAVDSGVEMLSQINERFVNPTQLYIISQKNLDNMQSVENLLYAIGKDKSEATSYHGYPPVLVSLGPLQAATTRPKLFTLEEFIDLPASRVRDLFFTDESIQ